MKKWSRFGLAASAVAVTLPLTVLGATGGANASTVGPKLTGRTHGVTLTLMFGSSGPAETAAVKAAAKAWGNATHNKVNVVMTQGDQTITEAFAGGAPPDVFYMDPPLFTQLASHNQLLAYAKDVAPASNFYSALVKEYTYGGKWYAVPKDSSNLALEINTTMWHAAGLTNRDLPTTWAKLQADAKKLTNAKKGVVGIDMTNDIDRVGAFFAENGGSYISKNGKSFVFNSPQNIQALTFLQKLAKEGVLKWNPQQSAGWAGQAFGQGQAAMTNEGNWIIGAMQSTYPKIKWEAVPMPVGPHGQHGTLTFTNAWGIPSQSAGEKNSAAAVSFVKYLASVKQQVKFAEAFGVLPSRISAAKQYSNRTPMIRPFIQGAAYALPQVNAIGWPTVHGAFNTALLSLATSSPKGLLDQLETNAKALGKP